ncbi:MAG: hypothetical protein E6G34_06820 [Actinobacteria bacterium]|nr:MAG: hypothetical protein E6G34_06820 [Actinomycetota bacterium]
MSVAALLVGLFALLAPGPAAAEGVAATPIPQNPSDVEAVPAFTGSPAKPRPVFAPTVPQNPFMAPNGRSNLHDDAYMTNTYTWSGPLGNSMQTLSTFQAAECGSLTVDRLGRLVTVCIGLEGVRVLMLDPRTLELLAAMELPPRKASTGNPFTSFSGGGYFYLDQNDRAVIPTTNNQIWVVGETSGPSGPGFELVRAYDLSSFMSSEDAIISALPDWSGRIWFATTHGLVGTIDQASGAVKLVNLGEAIGNSFAVDKTGGVFIVTDRALYRFDAAADNSPRVSWRETYANIGIVKPGQTEDGSGTTPNLMGGKYVAITDNADPMDVVVYRRAKSVTGSRLVCTVPVFEPGASSTDNSLIGTGHSIVVENNFGYTGPTATTNGASTAPGIERIDINTGGTGCSPVWHSPQRAPSAVPKLSLANGLVYAYTKPPRSDEIDAWYLTALSFRTGATVYEQLAGTGLGFNSNYAPVSIGPDGSAYVGALGGLVELRDG